MKEKRGKKAVGIFFSFALIFFPRSHSASAQSHDVAIGGEKKVLLHALRMLAPSLFSAGSLLLCGGTMCAFLEQNQRNSIDGQAMKNCDRDNSRKSIVAEFI